MKPLENTYFQDMDYAICIRKEVSMCGADFTSEDDFSVDSSRTTGGGCTGDFLSFGTNPKCGNAGAVAGGVKLGKVIKNLRLIRYL